METVYLSLGSNVGDRVAHLKAAILQLEKLGEMGAVSSFYETEPVEFTDQPWFVNAVAAVRSELAPAEFLAKMLAIEKNLGRERNLPKGPRTIDLDILLYGRQVVKEAGLTIPHPGLHRRRFALEPLCEIAPNAFHPVFMRSLSDLLAALPPSRDAVRKL